ncbi:MAG: CoB--CoM heterodisulfide reductase iron-sulfur subunit A family protein [Deltaproteobacteria bacterium]|nr:CoB--CoM heterodisulfide reductase iron-sulfur subunit A family protein [Deltaproteobacteria bacterium]
MSRKIGVYICECGPNIKDAVDMATLLAEAKGHKDVVLARSFGFLCSPDGKEFLKEDIQVQRLSRVVIAGCSPKENEHTFRDVLKSAGLNPFLLQVANIREQCAWVIHAKPDATEKARELIRGAIKRVGLHEPLEIKTIACCADVLVVGAGVAGISTALTVARKNRKVYLIDKEPCIGGKVARHEDLYPDMVCASCLIESQLDAVLHHDDIEVLTLTEMVEVKGSLGNFIVNVRQKARFVDLDACIGCGACFEACPVTVPGSFMGGMAGRKAIHIPYAGALPNVALIDEDHCLRFQGESCHFCLESCPFGAIRYEETEGIRELKVGAVVLATGFGSFDPQKDDRYGYGKIENIITSLEFEQLVNSNGPTEGKILMINGRPPRNIAFVHCVGSRTEKFNEYCSGVCCLYTLKHAHQARLQLPESGICQFHSDLCLSGKDAQRFYRKVLAEDHIEFFRLLRPNAIEIRRGSGSILITHTDTHEELGWKQFDMVVLATAMESGDETERMADILDVKLGENGFFEEVDATLDPVSTVREGIFMAGCAQGPKDIPSSAAQGHAAAGRIMGKLLPGEPLALEPMACEIDPEICSGCLVCKSLCAFKAIAREDCEPKVSINQAMCRGCGVCAAACPSGAIIARHFSTRAMFSELRGLIG